MIVFGIGCSFRGWDVCIRDGVLVYGMVCCVRAEVLVNKIEC